MAAPAKEGRREGDDGDADDDGDDDDDGEVVTPADGETAIASHRGARPCGPS